MTGGSAVQALDTLATLAVFLVILYVVVEIAEASPVGFETGIDDQLEDAAGGWV